MSNWADAMRHLIDWLRCPHCGEHNSPTHHQIELVDGLATCATCSKSWRLSEGDFT
jgi:hypothetical protein